MVIFWAFIVHFSEVFTVVTPQQLKLDVARTPNRFAAVNFALSQELGKNGGTVGFGITWDTHGIALR